MLRKFWQSESGNFGAITAIAAVPILAGIAGAIDYTMTLNKTGQLQNSLDAAALAIATGYYQGMSDDELGQVGQDSFDANMAGISSGTQSMDYEDELPDDLAAMATADGDEFFITATSGLVHQGLVGGMDWTVNRRSVVRIRKGPPACVLALDPKADSAVKIQGSTDVVMEGCVIAANSKSSTAIYRGGAALLEALCVNTVGRTSGLGNISNVQLDCAAPMENQYPSFDPLLGVVPPSYTGCQGLPGGKTKTLSPGTYCNKTISGDVTLQPGTYILRGGQVKLGGNGKLVGSGVTIFLMEGAEFSVNGNEILQLTPPTSGPYAGITIFQEKTNTNTIAINGTSGSFVSGFVYAPGAHVFYAGNSATSTLTACLRLVSKTIEMTGNSSMKSDCSAELGGRDMLASRYMSIVR